MVEGVPLITEGYVEPRLQVEIERLNKVNVLFQKEILEVPGRKPE
jgi:hypothetical protein